MKDFLLRDAKQYEDLAAELARFAGMVDMVVTLASSCRKATLRR
jgi:hypothetical protein